MNSISDLPSSALPPPAPSLSDRERPQYADSARRIPDETNQAEKILPTFLVGLLAFLLASSVARNTDIWLHLAKGRFFAQHGFAPADSSWLYDLLSFTVYSVFGGPGLVFVKALVVVALALVMLRMCRNEGQGTAAPIFCTSLALLAMSARLLLQPTTVSYLLLLLALGLVWQRSRARSARPAWQLLLLFLIWANMDSWFVLGLAVVALVWLGEVLDGTADAAGHGQSRFAVLLTRLGWIVLLGIVCLLNPAFYRAFTLPAELQGIASADAATPGSLSQVMSPFQRTYFTNLRPTAAGIAYYPLLALTLFSFLLNRTHWSWQRFLPVLALAALSAWQVRAVPFFAVAAGPVLAWNIQDWLMQRFPSPQTATGIWARILAGGPALMLVVLVVLLVCAWPGWLQSPPFEPRHWTVELSPSLEQGARAANEWQKRDKQETARWLHLSADSAAAFAWFCPEIKTVQDARLAAAFRGGEKQATDWPARMRAAGIDHVIVYDSDRVRLFSALGYFLDDPHQWPLLYAEGYFAVFSWRDPQTDNEGGTPEGPQNVSKRAFHPAAEKRAERTASFAEPESRQWWHAFWKATPPRTLDQEEASLYLLRAQAMLRSAPQRHMQMWESCQLACLMGAAGTAAETNQLLDLPLGLTFLHPQMPERESGFAALPLLDQMAHAIRGQFDQQYDDTSPALLYLAIRAARRALALNPEDAQSYLVLGESYRLLQHGTRERVWLRQMPELAQLRLCQASAALNQAIALKPDLAQAHLSLSRLYAEMGYLDLALGHLREYAKWLRQAGPTSGMSREQLRQRREAIQEELSQLSREVEKRQSKFLVDSVGWKVGDRAAKAVQAGLGGKARDLLLESDIAAFGNKGMATELELLLRTGRPKAVLEWISPEQGAKMGMSYHWMRIQALAAVGDYGTARAECNELSGSLALATPGRASVQYRPLMAQAIGRRVQAELMGRRTIVDLLLQEDRATDMSNRVPRLAQALRKEADMTVLRGLMALEEGDSEEAEIAFRMALSVWKDAVSATEGSSLDFNSRPVAQGYLQLMMTED